MQRDAVTSHFLRPHHENAPMGERRGVARPVLAGGQFTLAAK
jgi:hypothetical protein